MPQDSVATRENDARFIIIGGGPAGLTAAYELVKQGHAPLVLEKLDKVGGIARTESFRGYYFDMGGHRFFTRSPLISRLWHEMLGPDFLTRARLSRIYYRDRFFSYPLKPLNALAGLGLVEGARILLSYLRWHLWPYREVETFEQWVTNRFGKRLFETFFKSYTEKVWGIPTSELKAEWAVQRIQELSLKNAITSMLIKPEKEIATLIDAFEYPRRGPGMMWSAFQERIEAGGGIVQLSAEVTAVHRAGSRVTGVTISRDGQSEHFAGDHFIASMPITELVTRLQPPAPPEVLHAATQLNYRDFLTVCLIVNQETLFPDNWIYIHDPAVRVGRIQNFKNWSADMVPDAGKTSLGLEYFCTEGDALWSLSDAELVELGRQEVARIGLARYEDIEDGCVFRVPKSYPIYDAGYRAHLDILKSFVGSLENMQTIGRNGLHRYNNQDHAMLTGIYAVRNLLYDEGHDLWQVNADAVYQEGARALPRAQPVAAAPVSSRAG